MQDLSNFSQQFCLIYSVSVRLRDNCNQVCSSMCTVYQNNAQVILVDFNLRINLNYKQPAANKQTLQTRTFISITKYHYYYLLSSARMNVERVAGLRFAFRLKGDVVRWDHSLCQQQNVCMSLHRLKETVSAFNPGGSHAPVARCSPTLCVTENTHPFRTHWCASTDAR